MMLTTFITNITNIFIIITIVIVVIVCILLNLCSPGGGISSSACDMSTVL